MEAAVASARARVAQARRIVVLTGAGISTDSGIPDFRGPNGVWTRDPAAEKASHIDHYLADPEVRRRAWRSRLASPAWQAQPNAGHRALVELERTGRLLCLITQNIDGLHQAAGSDRALVVEVHGTMRDAMCLDCGDRMPMEQALARVAAGEDDPPCQRCGGILKSATISFGQALVTEDLDRAEAAARSCDLLLAVGSTLSVYPIAGVVPVAKASGAEIVIVNGEETAMDELGDVVVRGSIAEVLPRIVS
ncbi:MAG: SIR2 family NAD-dependent protein deacylase [Microthrixaceae bacterium]